MGQTSEGSGGEEEIRTNVKVHGGRGLVEIVREPDLIDDGETANIPVLSIREAKTAETVVLVHVIQAVGGYCSETCWWWRYGLSIRERNRTVRSRIKEMRREDKEKCSTILRGDTPSDVELGSI